MGHNYKKMGQNYMKNKKVLYNNPGIIHNILYDYRESIVRI